MFEIDGVFRRQPGGLRQPRHRAERTPSSCLDDRVAATIEKSRVAAELVDDETVNARSLCRRKHCVSADDACDRAAPVDVGKQDHRHVGRLGKTHVGDVAGAEVYFGRAARALDEDDIR